MNNCSNSGAMWPDIGKALLNVVSDSKQIRLIKNYIRALKRTGIEDYELGDGVAAIIAAENNMINERLANSMIKISKGNMDATQKMEFIRGLIIAKKRNALMNFRR